MAALDAFDRPDPVDGPSPRRTLVQRRADALVALAAGDARPTITIDVKVDIDTLAGRPPLDLTTGCCEITGLGPVPAATVQTLACDAHHRTHWTRHGETEIDNLELRCRQHHIARHRRDHEASRHRSE